MRLSSETTDTSLEAQAVQLDGLRNLSPRERIRKMCALSRHVRKMAFDAIRRRHPDLSDEDVRLMFIELTYGEALAASVRCWMTEHTD